MQIANISFNYYIEFFHLVCSSNHPSFLKYNWNSITASPSTERTTAEREKESKQKTTRGDLKWRCPAVLAVQAVLAVLAVRAVWAVWAVRAVWPAVCDCFGFGLCSGCFGLFGLFGLLGALGVEI